MNKSGFEPGFPPGCTFSHYTANPLPTNSSDYSKLPSTPTVDMVFLLDPLIATGGTAVAAVNMLTDWGIPGLHDYLPIFSIEPRVLI